MEVLIRIHETVAGVAKRGGTPQLKYLPVAGARRFYGELNDIAHPSNIGHLRELLALDEPSEGVVGVSPIPELRQDIAIALYQLHVYLLFETLREVIQLMVEMYSVDDEPIQKAIRLVTYVGEILEASGTFVRDD